MKVCGDAPLTKHPNSAPFIHIGGATRARAKQPQGRDAPAAVDLVDSHGFNRGRGSDDDPCQRLARENPTWGRLRIQAELALLGYTVAELTVAKYMHRTSPRPSPTWRVFLATHARDIVAVDFFLVPTLTFRLLFVFVVLRHDRRELLHVNVTDHPTAGWTARQLVEAFPEETAPKYLLRDRGAICDEVFAQRVTRMRIREVRIAPRSPGRIPSWTGSSARFAASASTTLSCSASSYVDNFRLISVMEVLCLPLVFLFRRTRPRGPSRCIDARCVC